MTRDKLSEQLVAVGECGECGRTIEHVTGEGAVESGRCVRCPCGQITYCRLFGSTEDSVANLECRHEPHKPDWQVSRDNPRVTTFE